MISRVRKLLRKVRRAMRPSRSIGYRYRPGHTVIDDFSEFSGLPVPEVEASINRMVELARADWKRTEGKDFSEKSLAYYGSSQNYVFDLLENNPSPDVVREKLDRTSPRILESIREHQGRRLLEFGGGLGVFCEVASRLGKEVTYLDLAGRPSDFARWRFEKYRLPITVVLTGPESVDIAGSYDIIFTDAVLEHLPPDRQVAAVRRLGQCLAPGGIFICLVDLSGESPDVPSHTDVDVGLLHRTIAGEGLRCEMGQDAYCSIWRRPV